jgi:hypothetical protein
MKGRKQKSRAQEKSGLKINCKGDKIAKATNALHGK